MTRRQLRIIRGDRSGADDDRVRQRAHAMQVQDVFLSGDELRVAGVRGDETVEALAEMADRDRVLLRGAADRQIQVDQRVRGIVRRQEQFPAALGLPGKSRSGIVGLLPGARQRPPARLWQRLPPDRWQTSRVRSDSDSVSRLLAAANATAQAPPPVCTVFEGIGVGCSKSIRHEAGPIIDFGLWTIESLGHDKPRSRLNELCIQITIPCSPTYGELAVKIALNLQPHQRLLIIGPIANGGASLDAAPLVRKVTESAYRAGARYVETLWGDEALQLARLQPRATRFVRRILRLAARRAAASTRRPVTPSSRFTPTIPTLSRTSRRNSSAPSSRSSRAACDHSANAFRGIRPTGR